MFKAGRTPWVFLLPALLGLALFRLAPIGVAAVGSFYTEGLTGEMHFTGLDNLVSVATDPDMVAALLRTLLFVAVVVPLVVGMSFALALLVQAPTRFSIACRTILVLPVTMSVALTAVLWNLLFDPILGPVNTVLSGMGFERQFFFRGADQALPTMVALATWRASGYWMIFMLAGLLAIAPDLREAARIDGATRWQSLRYITLPLMTRTFAFVAVGATAVAFLFFAPILVITSGGPEARTELLMFKAYEAGFLRLNHGRALAISLALLVLVGIFAVLELRLLRARE